MVRCLAAMLLGIRIKPQSFLSATCVYSCIGAILKLGLLRMEATESQIRSYKFLVAGRAFERHKSSPYLPVDFLPRYVLFLEKLNEPIDVPVSICYMLRNH
jgi:hypothetical protein